MRVVRQSKLPVMFLKVSTILFKWRGLYRIVWECQQSEVVRMVLYSLDGSEKISLILLSGQRKFHSSYYLVRKKISDTEKMAESIFCVEKMAQFSYLNHSKSDEIGRQPFLFHLSQMPIGKSKYLVVNDLFSYAAVYFLKSAQLKSARRG